MFNFNDIFNDVSGTDFEEIPVGIEEFVTSPEYLNMGETPLSDYQYQLIRASSQIYKEETLIALHGEDEGRKRFKRETKQEVIAMLGKGSGKDFTSTIACSYIVYLLLCLKDPARYYEKPPGDSIDIINVAVSAAQANNVFFKNFKKRILEAPWFKGKFDAGKAGEISFDKNITVYSGHSERESFEGYNLFFCVLDEISAFAMQNNSGNVNAKTAQAVYDMYRASVTSRFPENGKIVLLSFPRHKNDFITTRYNEVIVDKEVVVREHTFKLDKDLEDGIPENEFTVQWDEDHIVSYNTPGVWALRRPSWEVNPTKSIDMYMRDFYENPRDALGRYAAMPPEGDEDSFLRDEAKVDRALVGMNAIIPTTGVYVPGWEPDSEKTYYAHVDLAQKHDRCAVAVAHVERWITVEDPFGKSSVSPVVAVDLVRYWTPTKNQTVDFSEVRAFLTDLPRRGFTIGKVTFDQWNSTDMIKYLQSMGMRSETLSVGNPEYMDLASLIAEERLRAPNDSILRSELIALRIMPNGKIDHPRTGGKDVADAVTGAVYNAVAHTRHQSGDTVDVVTLSDLKRSEAKEREQQMTWPIRPPGSPSKPPEEIEEFLMGLRLI